MVCVSQKWMLQKPVRLEEFSKGGNFHGSSNNHAVARVGLDPVETRMARALSAHQAVQDWPARLLT
jgi:hypothetical protein